MKKSYSEYIKLNKNLFLSIVVALTISAIVAQLLADQEDYLNTSYTLLADLAVFYSTFGTLFYVDNRKKYLTKFGKIDAPRLKKDLIKIVSSIGAGEVVYIVVRWYLQYYLLIIHYEPYAASIITHLISAIIYLAIVNLGVNLTKLYKDGT
jgi:Na+-driven multidrug efflux pump